MTTPTRRKCQRWYDKAPIAYAGANASHYLPAVMHNSSCDGIYFECEASLDRDHDLFIKAQRDLSRNTGTNPCRNFRAKVKWCRQLITEKKSGYGIGVQFTARSHLSYGINLENTGDRCDLCDQYIAQGQIHRTEKWIFLCPSCLRYMESLPSGSEQVLERYLLGNVV